MVQDLAPETGYKSLNTPSELSLLMFLPYLLYIIENIVAYTYTKD